MNERALMGEQSRERSYPYCSVVGLRKVRVPIPARCFWRDMVKLGFLGRGFFLCRSVPERLNSGT